MTITKTDRTDFELQMFWVYCICVAGKNADYASRVVGKMLSQRPQEQSPFDYLTTEGEVALRNRLVAHKVGQYTRITRAIWESRELNLRECTHRMLEEIYGVGPKTARFFILHSRRDALVAVLDTHILRWLREVHGLDGIPLQTPQDRAHYHRVEIVALRMMRLDFPGVPLAEADMMIWSVMSGRSDGGDFGFGNVS